MLVLGILLSEVGSVLAEVITLQVFGALKFLVLVFALLKGFLEGDFLLLKTFEFLGLLLLFLLNCLGLGSVNGKFVVGLLWLDLGLEDLALALESVLVRCEALELSLSGLRLLKDHLNSLETLLFVIELTSEHIIQMFTVLTRLISQVVEHLLRAEILTSNLLSIHQALTD